MIATAGLSLSFQTHLKKIKTRYSATRSRLPKRSERLGGGEEAADGAYRIAWCFPPPRPGSSWRCTCSWWSRRAGGLWWWASSSACTRWWWPPRWRTCGWRRSAGLGDTGQGGGGEIDTDINVSTCIHVNLRTAPIYIQTHIYIHKYMYLC